jgi:hypothetical protein
MRLDERNDESIIVGAQVLLTLPTTPPQLFFVCFILFWFVLFFCFFLVFCFFCFYLFICFVLFCFV